MQYTKSKKDTEPEKNALSATSYCRDIRGKKCNGGFVVSVLI